MAPNPRRLAHSRASAWFLAQRVRQAVWLGISRAAGFVLAVSGAMALLLAYPIVFYSPVANGRQSERG